MTNVPSSLPTNHADKRSIGSAYGTMVGSTLVLSGLSMLGFGIWAFFAPDSFGAFINYAPYNEHLIRDLGAFQMGIGITVLLAFRWRDPIKLALTGYVTASGVHTLSHVLDHGVGGHVTDVATFGTLTLIGLVGLWLHARGRTS